ncbi:hypothetical protein COHA_008037 [Chlorella ohadii]|uniref:glutamate--tRNA ligase n=1 Tax=Chlorella ohadii TaxID=2649997 RepID=A0AAD5GZD0_9CHLO|nr:hypothetical protein COHA_008037 [Chlorella ohadii]
MLALRCGGRVLAGAAQQQRGALLHVTRRVAPAAAAWGAQLSSKASRKAGRQPLKARAAAATTLDSPAAAGTDAAGQEVRVRFAPSPTGYLHVGGARTALFNWLFAKNVGGKMVLRIEDTDAARSTRESEEAVLTDLKWLGIHWDEGPDCGGPHGPYRQSERKEIYKKYVDQLVAEGKAYPCFCTDEELEAMKKEAEEKKLPPIYRGKWASASQAEVDEMLAKGVPHCYRFRVPKSQVVTIQDVIRGDVSWNTDTLGDFVLLRSNGLPVYNFCVAIDDALMRISHVLIYQSLGFPTPVFGHVSLILAPDKSKLSKRHGATSVGEFREDGYLAQAMLNYLSLLGWNDGSEQEIYSVEELQKAFSLERITKSAAVFDKTKLSWMNGQHLRGMPADELAALVGGRWVASGLLARAESPFVAAALAIVQNSLELVADADRELRALLSYPLAETLGSEAAKAVVEDNFQQVAEAVLAAHDSGELAAAVASGHDGYKKWVNSVGKAQGRKGKRLFMPMRVALTGRMAGPDVGDVLGMLALESGDVADAAAYVQLPQRMEQLRAWLAANPAPQQ